MKPANILYIMSDEHSPKMLGCYGHAQIKTPNLDRLAARGTRFSAAYTNSPICIPARAAFATGRYTHETRYWDNALPYDGKIRGWGHRLLDEGIRVESIGKLHYRNADLPTGFGKQIKPMHVMDGIGQVWGSVRDPLPNTRPAKMLNTIGPGESDYNRYDQLIADEACAWLQDVSRQEYSDPWVLYVGFVAPHFPLVVPDEFYSMYPIDSLPPRKLDPYKGHRRHPWLQRMDDFSQVDRHLTPEQRLMAVASYFGLCSFLDHQVGRVLDKLDALGLAGETRVIYCSDHGDNVGARGLWGKSNMYEESAGVPLIAAGPDIPEGAVSATPVTLLDSYQTILEGCGLEPSVIEQDLRGHSWFATAREADDRTRIAFSEYHAACSPTGAFMVRRGDFKLIYYVGYEPELFNLKNDEEETENLAINPSYAGTLQDLEAALRAIVDPEKADRMAKDDQNALVATFGGREKALITGTPGATPVPAQGHE
ncbi:MAG: sulfatase-like hydrolase/transferase [Pseudomonadota bacterium]|nr:sulfatase-like hydrolase/transferase [Pseudomonadota bacterium]